ncbi:DUF6279 family lipoprotein [Leptothrix discophora]|uniref:DUF6279 family lipoprotein n=1 Tax=Leptothrix discophora TaxID=89 RepID=A0ABT9G7G1_LEPDI|nr:DUF6279 family lipoprotein [Leptothrix discophora]MDP4302428.1 DUF6279 family lipoprotein [Leptothrix discophora]
MTLVALLAAACMASGCSALRLAYGQGPTLTYWWLDAHVDFDNAQAPKVRAAIEQWFDWHRREPLADLSGLLDQAAVDLRGELTPAQACTWWQRLSDRRDRYLQRLAVPMAEVAATLRPDQITHIRARFDKVNADWREEMLDPDPRRRAKASVERVIERAERLYGRLDREQREWVADWMRRSPWDAQRWLDEREADQRETIALLNELSLHTGLGGQNLTPAQRVEKVRAWMRRVVEPSSDVNRAQQERVLENQCGFAAALQARTTPGQRDHAGDTLRGWAEDLRSHQLPILPGGPAIGLSVPAARP